MKTKPKYKYPLVVLEWDDAVSYGDADGEPTHEPSRQFIAGWLIKQDKAGVTVAGEYYRDDTQRRDEAFIPAGMIVNLRVVE